MKKILMIIAVLLSGTAWADSTNRIHPTGYNFVDLYLGGSLFEYGTAYQTRSQDRVGQALSVLTTQGRLNKIYRVKGVTTATGCGSGQNIAITVAGYWSPFVKYIPSDYAICPDGKFVIYVYTRDGTTTSDAVYDSSTNLKASQLVLRELIRMNNAKVNSSDCISRDITSNSDLNSFKGVAPVLMHSLCDAEISAIGTAQNGYASNRITTLQSTAWPNPAGWQWNRYYYGGSDPSNGYCAGCYWYGDMGMSATAGDRLSSVGMQRTVRRQISDINHPVYLKNMDNSGSTYLTTSGLPAGLTGGALAYDTLRGKYHYFQKRLNDTIIDHYVSTNGTTWSFLTTVKTRHICKYGTYWAGGWSDPYYSCTDELNQWVPVANANRRLVDLTEERPARTRLQFSAAYDHNTDRIVLAYSNADVAPPTAGWATSDAMRRLANVLFVSTMKANDTTGATWSGGPVHTNGTPPLFGFIGLDTRLDYAYAALTALTDPSAYNAYGPLLRTTQKPNITCGGTWIAGQPDNGANPYGYPPYYRFCDVAYLAISSNIRVAEVSFNTMCANTNGLSCFNSTHAQSDIAGATHYPIGIHTRALADATIIAARGYNSILYVKTKYAYNDPTAWSDWSEVQMVEPVSVGAPNNHYPIADAHIFASDYLGKWTMAVECATVYGGVVPP